MKEKYQITLYPTILLVVRENPLSHEDFLTASSISTQNVVLTPTIIHTFPS